MFLFWYQSKGIKKAVFGRERGISWLISNRFLAPRGQTGLEICFLFGAERVFVGRIQLAGDQRVFIPLNQLLLQTKTFNPIDLVLAKSFKACALSDLK